MTLEKWLETVAAKQATPGGGAAAGLAAATAAALVGMVGIYTTGPKWLDRQTDMQRISDQAGLLRGRALDLMQADEQAFAAVGTAYARPKADTGRLAAIQAALIGAAEPPRQIAVLANEIITLLATLVTRANPNVISDVAVAASLARAALESAIVNIEINAALIDDGTVQAQLHDAAVACEAAIGQAAAVVAAVRQKIATH